MPQIEFGSEEVSKMGFVSFIKGVYRRLFPIKDIKTALNIKIAISQEMLNKINAWQNCYAGNAIWLDENVKSLRLEQAITREFANIVLNEMTAGVSVPKLDQLFKNAIRDLNINLQSGLATGAMIIKPLGMDKVQYVSANSFIPIEFDSRGRLLKVVFPEFKKLNDVYYTRLEYHSLDKDRGLTISNKAYRSVSEGQLGTEIPLSMIDEWENLPSAIAYPMMKRPAFGYYRNPINNCIDGSHCGVSIFDSALDLIKLTDIQFGRLDWEFESGERLILVDDAALQNKETIDGLKRADMPKLNDRLFIMLGLSGGANGEDFYKEFSPQFRQADIISGLEEYKRNIEFSVGLSYGDISNPQTITKTATEIKSAKERKYNTVTAIQNNLRDCLDDLVYALAFYNSLITSGYSFACSFKDSILTDEETERKQDIQDLNLGIMRPEEYRAKWYGEDIDKAAENLPQTAQVID